MYLGIDIGGSKTLIASFDDAGTIVQKEKHPTPLEYDAFLAALADHLKEFDLSQVTAIGVAAPGIVNRETGVAKSFGNLKWHDKPIAPDIAKLVNNLPLRLENDAKAAVLAEAQYIKDEFKKVIYITVSTGIGAGVTVNGILDPGLQDCEVGFMQFEHEGKLMPWEDFASGQAIHEKYGQLASEIPAGSELWDTISHNLAIGIINIAALVQPDVVVIGGGVGTHLPKFIDVLTTKLSSLALPMVAAPPVRQAKYPEEAVIYGCYQLARQLHETTPH